MKDPRTPLVVFLHGQTGRPSDFDAIAGRLPERFPVLAPCLHLGQGDAGSAIDLADRLDEEVGGETRGLVLVGSSLGCTVALAWAARRGRRVRGLVLSGCPDVNEGRGPDAIGSVRAPVLLLWGTEDRVTPSQIGHRLRDRLPGARLLFVLEAGHEPAIDRPSVFAFHLSSFLNDLAPLSVPPRRFVDEAA